MKQTGRCLYTAFEQESRSPLSDWFKVGAVYSGYALKVGISAMLSVSEFNAPPNRVISDYTDVDGGGNSV